MRTNSSRDLRDLQAGERILIRKGPFAGKTGVIVESLDGSLENGAEPAVFFVTVQVCAFGGTAFATFKSPTSDDMECLQRRPSDRRFSP